MTQEEKYKEALLEARAVLEPCLKYSKGKVREALDSIDNELKSFESEDERIREWLVYYFKAIGKSWLHHRDISIEQILAYLEKQKEQKPEWNANDKAFIKDCARILDENGYTASAERLLSMFGQKPVSISCGHENDAEWDQEDKEKIVTISEIIEHCTTIPYSGGTLTLNKEYKKELLCFIRTLRPSWKPSKEQMNSLLNSEGILRSLQYDEHAKNIAELYEQLKKL